MSTPQKSLWPRRILTRLGLVVLYCAAIYGLFISGKGHTLLLDNQAMEGVTPLAEGFSVSVDGRKPVQFSFGLDRDKIQLQGQWHRITISGLADGHKLEKDFTIDLNDDIALLSIPKLVAGIEPAVSPFVPKNGLHSPEPSPSPLTGPGADLPDGGLLL